MKSDKIILFLLQNLTEKNTNIGQNLFIVVSERIYGRKNYNMINLKCSYFKSTDKEEELLKNKQLKNDKKL